MIKELLIGILIVRHPYATINEQKHYVKDSILRLNSQYHIHLVPEFKVTNDTLRINALSEYDSRLPVWALKAKHMFNRKDLYHIMLPPVTLDGDYYLGGAATGVCTWGIRNASASYSIAVRQRLTGTSFAVHSRTGIQHEISHTLGAFHINKKPNLMHEDALRLITNRGLPILKDTKVEVKACLEAVTISF